MLCIAKSRPFLVLDSACTFFLGPFDMKFCPQRYSLQPFHIIAVYQKKRLELPETSMPRRLGSKI